MEANINPDWKFLKRIQKKFGNKHSLKILFYMVSKRSDDTYKYYTWLERSNISNIPEDYISDEIIIYKMGVDFATNRAKYITSDGHYKESLEASLCFFNSFDIEDVFK